MRREKSGFFFLAKILSLIALKIEMSEENSHVCTFTIANAAAAIEFDIFFPSLGIYVCWKKKFLLLK
jgi:hypothetical protein